MHIKTKYLLWSTMAAWLTIVLLVLSIMTALAQPMPTNSGAITFRIPSVLPANGNIWIPIDVDRTKIPSTETEFLLWVQNSVNPIMARVGYYPLFSVSGRDSVLVRGWSQPPTLRYRFIAQTYRTVDYSDWFSVSNTVDVRSTTDNAAENRVYFSGEHSITTEITLPNTGETLLRVVNVLGQTLFTKTIFCTAGQNTFTVELPPKLPNQILRLTAEFNDVVLAKHVFYHLK